MGSENVGAKRRPVTYRIDERITKMLELRAKKKNTSVNREIENMLLEILKAEGEIQDDFIPLGETRGGDRRSKEAQND